MSPQKNFTVLYCLLFGISPLLGMNLKNVIPYSALIGWGLAIVFLFCAIISINKQYIEKEKPR